MALKAGEGFLVVPPKTWFLGTKKRVFDGGALGILFFFRLN